MADKRPLLVIGSLPPVKSAAAALGLHMARTLASTYSVTFVIDDLAPPPPSGLPFQHVRTRNLQSDWAQYKGHARLYIVGGEGDSLSALELLEKAPGIVLPASLDMADLAIPFCKATNKWPDHYWHWLHHVAGKHAETLYKARVHFGRESRAQGRELPAFSLLLSAGSAIVSPGAAASRALQASGLSPSASLNALPSTGQQQPAPTTVRRVLYVSETSLACQKVRKDLSVFQGFAHMEHLSIHPASPHLAEAIIESDLTVLLSGRNDTCSPALSVALAASRYIVTASQPWAANLPPGSHISVGHPEAYQALTAAVGALSSDASLRASLLACRTKEETTGETYAPLFTLLDQAPAEADLPVKAAQECGETVPESMGGVWPAQAGAMALIGAVPPPVVLKAQMPDLRINICPRFATPALARRIAEIMPEHPASVLAEMGYEAPVILAQGQAPDAHRQALAWPTIREGLHAKEAISFACQVDQTVPYCNIQKEKSAPLSLRIAIDFDETDRKAPSRGYLPEYGLFWHHDTVRHTMHCILMVGQQAEFLLKMAGDTACMVSGTTGSHLVHSERAANLSSDELGLLHFSLMGLETPTGAPVTSTCLRKRLADTGLILEWS
ncbi:MAG: hypothetical protein HWE25_03245 [Alphaproteobacteria bacterium]|nr:hypothetical protein [Alphaproteobacteria bacterium]